jgi:hypothetical protein
MEMTAKIQFMPNIFQLLFYKKNIKKINNLIIYQQINRKTFFNLLIPQHPAN